MNSQNILKFYGSKLDIKLDSSEFYDYELSKVDGDYDIDVLNFTTPITYTGLTIDTNLEDFSCDRSTITILEYDNTVNNPNYIYSGISFTINYDDFVNYFEPSYENTILNNHIYTYTGFTSEIHYFKINGYNNTLDTSILSGFSKNIINCLQKLADPNNCCPITLKLSNKPWVYKFDTGAGSNNCDPIIKRRTEKGWSLDFIFNKENLNWSYGGIFYYLGVRGDENPNNYADNNLSFGFTSDGKIKWTAIHYSGYCATNLGYQEVFYTASGLTPTICIADDTKDFNITITFDRYKHYTDCDIENDGGWNDLLPGPHLIPYTPTNENVTSTHISTGYYLTNSTGSTLSGESEVYVYTEELNKKWANERQRRLGTLKIYINGRPIYKLEDWEEVIPSSRGVQPFIQSWGGGTSLMNNIHAGVCCFNMKSIKYYEEPLDFVHVRHNFITRQNQYDFFICGIGCEDGIIGLFSNGLLTEDSIQIITENDNIVLF